MDFGLAKPTTDNNDDDRVLVGTPGYMAPELFKQGEPGPKSDLFAMGCLAVELLTGQKLFGQSQPHEFVAAVAKWSGWDPESLDITIPKELANAITSWLDPSPQNRMANLESISQWAATVQLPDDVDILDSFDEFDPTWTEDDALDSTETF
jgi:serine/threonine protein kinase